MTAVTQHPPGPILFARYAYPPNSLGYCGPADVAALGQYATENVRNPDALAGLADLARRFEGAWPYLALIAAVNGRADPLDHDVVQAYWIGNNLLERVTPALLAAHVAERFGSRLGRDLTNLAGLALAGGRAHHNFHVFCAYPWVGMLRGGRVAEPLRVLQQCRIRWGRVVAIDGDHATVDSQPLVWTGRELALGPAQPEVVTLAARGQQLASSPPAGAVVTMHWDWLCDTLDPPGLARLRHYTATQLQLANQALGWPVADRVLAAG